MRLPFSIRRSLLSLLLGLSTCLGHPNLCAQETSKETVGKAAATKESEGRIYGALVLAQPEVSAPEAKAKPEGLSAEAGSPFPALVPRLDKAFKDYRSFTLLGEHRQELFKQYETWVVPSKDLFLKIDSKGPAPGGGVRLHLQVWRDKEVILKTDPVLKKGKPLFIGGPKWRDGKLLIVVGLDDEGVPVEATGAVGAEPKANP